jgi:methylenetetrahydrofolate dehydrogenase (NADP+) / methenyltetrahydrofolate cyclohydrolase
VTENASLIDGVAAADELIAQISGDVAQFTRESGITPGLALVALGDDPVQRLYVGKKVTQCERAGVRAMQHLLAESTTTEELREQLGLLNADPAVHGIFVQWPLPPHVNRDDVSEAIAPIKDVDCMHGANLARLFLGRPLFVPAAVRACHLLLRSSLFPLTGLNAVIAGGANVFAGPIAHILLGENCSVTIATRSSDDLAAICRRADILIAALGEPEVIRGDWIKPGATVIDTGMNVIADDNGRQRFTGDVKFEEASRVARAITPVPGGVGPMTIACLLLNTLEAVQRRFRKD